MCRADAGNLEQAPGSEPEAVELPRKRRAPAKPKKPPAGGKRAGGPCVGAVAAIDTAGRFQSDSPRDDKRQTGTQPAGVVMSAATVPSEAAGNVARVVPVAPPVLTQWSLDVRFAPQLTTRQVSHHLGGHCPAGSQSFAASAGYTSCDVSQVAKLRLYVLSDCCSSSMHVLTRTQ